MKPMFIRRILQSILAAWLLIACVAGAPALAAGVAASQPAWICPQLNFPDSYTNAGYRILKPGKGDWLFRDQTDLVVRPPVSGAVVDDFSRLNRQLARSGVRLIVFIAPPRGVMMRDELDPAIMAATHFSPGIAEVSYRTTLARLQSANIGMANVLDILDTPQAKAADKPFYLPGDPHWTPYGASASALAIAQAIARYPQASTLPVHGFTTALGPVKPVNQNFYREAYRICGQHYKPATSKVYVTSASGQAPVGLFGSDEVEVALVGTSFSTIEVGNFAGYLQQALRTEVANYGIGGGGLSESMLSYLSSDDYARVRPKFLIWEMQYHNLKEAADFPMILGAADGDCGKAALAEGRAVPVGMGRTPVLTIGPLQASRLKGPTDVVVDLTGPDARLYHIEVDYRDEHSDLFAVDASRWTHPANRTILHLAGDGAELASVSLVPDQRLTGQVSAHICRAPV